VAKVPPHQVVPKNVEQRLLFKHIDSESTFPVEAIQIETARGESALEISGARTEEDWGRVSFE
jgi:hypothetical protein